MGPYLSQWRSVLRQRTGPLTWPMALVAAEKGVGAVMAAAVAGFAFVVRREGLHAPLIRMIPGAMSPLGQDVARWLAMQLTPDMEIWGLAVAGWAAILAAEAVGVFCRRVWGELLVVVETGFWLPFELWDLAVKMSWTNGAILGMNAAIFAYVLTRQRHRMGRPPQIPALRDKEPNRKETPTPKSRR